MVYGLDTQALNNIWPSFTRFCRTISVRIRPETKIGRLPFLLFVVEVVFVLSKILFDVEPKTCQCANACI